MLDSQYVSLPLTLIESGFDPSAPPSPGARLAFTATAYCKGEVTSAGVNAQIGVTASDPTLLPLGSIVQLDFKEDRYDGIYSVLDTGPAIEGREIDLFMWNCGEAQRFGRKPVRMVVLRLGGDPHATTPGFLDRFLKKAAAVGKPAPPVSNAPTPSTAPATAPAAPAQEPQTAPPAAPATTP